MKIALIISQILATTLLFQGSALARTPQFSEECKDRIVDEAIRRSEEMNSTQKEEDKFLCSFKTDGPSKVKYSANLYTLLIPCHPENGAENENVISGNKTWNGMLFTVEVSKNKKNCEFIFKGNPSKTNLIDEESDEALTKRPKPRTPVSVPAVIQQSVDFWEHQSLFGD